LPEEDYDRLGLQKIHSCRTTRISQLLDIGVSETVRRQYVGHTAKDSHEGYSALVPDDPERAKGVLQKVNELAQQNPQTAHFPPIKGKLIRVNTTAIEKSGLHRLKATRARMNENEQQEDD
jgi:hypothetical protein